MQSQHTSHQVSTHTRETIPDEQRRRILERDGFACRYCGATYQDTLKAHHIDHITPVSAGGVSEDWNLVTACPRCNHKKNDSLDLQGVTQAEIVNGEVWEKLSDFLEVAEDEGARRDESVRAIRELRQKFSDSELEAAMAVAENMPSVARGDCDDPAYAVEAMATMARRISNGEFEPKLISDCIHSLSNLRKAAFGKNRRPFHLDDEMLTWLCDDIYFCTGYTGWDEVFTMNDIIRYFGLESEGGNG